MALIFADRVKETSSTTGLSNMALSGAVEGYESFVNAIGNSNTCNYCITDGVNWEVGVGTFTSGPNTLARDAVSASSNAGAKVTWEVGVKEVFVTLDAASITSLYDGAAGNIVVDQFNGGVDFTAGSTAGLTLSVAPVSENDITVSFDGVTQHHTEYSIVGTALTFISVIPFFTLSVEVVIGTGLSIGTPSDGTVTVPKLASDVIDYIGNRTYRKNLIINGDMKVNQRVFTTSQPASGSAFQYAADRWAFYNDRGAGLNTLSRQTDVPSFIESGEYFSASIDMTVNTALASPTGNNEAVFVYNMEGYDYTIIRGKTVNISFWVKSSTVGIYSFSFRNDAVTRTYVSEFTVDVADTWERKTITVLLNEPTGVWNMTNGRGLLVTIGLMSAPGYAEATVLDEWQTGNVPYSPDQTNLMATAGNYFRMTGVQIEEGDVATSYEQKSYHDELAACQRYYYQWAVNIHWSHPINRDNIYRASWTEFPVIMRVVPDCTVTGIASGGSFASTYPKIDSTTTSGASLRGDVNGVNAYSRFTSFTADAEIT